jgi:pimeloyl-ACP methyl ester carboxylesterase
MLFVSAIVIFGVSTLARAASEGTPREEELTFRSGTVTIAGTLSIPPGKGPFPAVVLLSGSGPQDRDSDLGGFKPFKMIADEFSRHGIAVLRCDDRGVGGSSGSIAESTTEELAGDALAAVQVLRERGDMEQSRIGLIGHSEGAIVAAIAAAKSADVSFIVWMAGSAVPGADILQMQAAAMPRAAGAPPDVVDDIVRKHGAFLTALKEGASDEEVIALGRALFAAQVAAMPEAQRQAMGPAAIDRLLTENLPKMRSPWMRFFVDFDPSDALRKVRCPVFAAFGGRDLQVPQATNRARLERALAEGRNQSVTIRLYPEANHLFMPAVTGQPAEYGTLPKVFVASLLPDMIAWIAGR